MKKLIHIFCLGIVLALASCTDFKEPGIELGGVSASPESLSFSSSGDSRNVYVKGGERWDISSKPAWLSVNSIQSSHYSWTVVLSAAANKDYNRSGSLTLTSKSSTATVSVTQSGEKGQYVPVTSVSVRPNSIELTEGDKYQLSAVFSPDNASNKTVSWESNATSVATVSSSGVVTAVAEGTATIKVRTEDGNYTATSTVTVRKRVINVTGVSLNKTSVTLTKGETSQLTATVSPSNATNPSVSWKSSSTSVATVSSSGLVKAADGGTATITVTTEDGNYTATCKVTVKVPVTGVSLDKTDLSLTEGDTYQLSATVSPSNATNKTVSWKSSATSVATVSSSGLITAKAEGSATITVTTEDGGKTATCRVTVKKKVISVTGVSVSPTSLTLTEGDTYQLSATVSPSNATNKSVKWQSSAAGIATVSSSGLVTAKLIGSATITVTTEDGSKTATCRVTVNKKTISVTGVSLNKTSVTLTEGGTTQLSATVAPSNATNQKVSWKSSATSVATVSSNGLVTANAEGSATITVTTEDGGYSASCRVTVNKMTISVTGVSVSPTSVTLTEGDTYQLTATVSPSNAADKNVKWQSNATSIATVSSTGLVKAVSAGTTSITVTTVDGGYMAICWVTVNKKTISVTGVSVSPTSVTLTEGNTYQLSATVSPSNATNKNVSWKSSATSVATVSSNGLITAKAEGSTYITAVTEDGGYSASCQVTVKKKTVSVTGVSVSPTSVTLTEGNTYQLSATVSPSNATNKTVRWTSNATSVATVSSNGLITAIAQGSATITATTEDGGYTATCRVTVNGTINGHAWVDLGLPSGLKWATCNVGASSSSDYGNYYAWGETSTKSTYYWTNYKFRVSGDKWDNVIFNKYNTQSNYGTIDNRTRLEMTDDAARANWGGSWRMPTDAEWTELRNNCNWTWTTQGGINGYKVTSRTNGNSIFLPAAGYRYESSLNYAGSISLYWSSSLRSDGPYDAWHVYFNSGQVNRSIYYRCYGCSVRPVSE